MTETIDTAIVARTESDRKLVGRLHTRCFELSQKALDRLEAILTDPVANRRDVLLAARLVLERTVPVVHRITATAATMHLPIPSDELAGPAVSTEEELRHETIGLLRGLLAEVSAMRQASNGSAAQAARPGLVLIRGGNGC